MHQYKLLHLQEYNKLMKLHFNVASLGPDIFSLQKHLCSRSQNDKLYSDSDKLFKFFFDEYKVSRLNMLWMTLSQIYLKESKFYFQGLDGISGLILICRHLI